MQTKTRAFAAVHHHRRPSRHGFTLVEMLVAVTLVLLLMSLFAQIFQIAGSSISTQRGLMENDQRARSVQTLLKADLDKRTFRYLVPFALNEDLTAAEVESAQRRGYFYISENDPFNDTDDVLALTVDTRVVQDSSDDTQYYGQALALVPDSFTTAQQYNFFRLEDNQPDRDDGRVDPNGGSDSNTAEICWFLRNGNLYRRVLLLRERDFHLSEDQQPTFDDGSGQRRFFQPVPGLQYPTDFFGATNFWHDFDFSAHSSQAKDSSMSPPVYNYDGALFNGLSSLNVPNSVPFIVDVAPEQIAYPPNRFGHSYVDRNPISSGDYATGGQPKEYTQSGGYFLGRFTQQETSDDNFTYPQQNHLSANCPVSNDLDVVNNHLVLASNTAIRYTDNGPRRGEDLVLANVHSFDVKIYDEVLRQFVDVGHSLTNGGLIGDFHINNRQNSFYGSGASTGNRVFDTWYPFDTSLPEDADSDGSLGAMEDQNANGELDPNQVLDFDDSGTIATEDSNGDGMLASGEDSIANGIIDHENNPPFRPRKIWPSDTSLAGFMRNRLDRWTATTDYTVGDRVFPPLGTQPGDPFYYVCIRAQEGDGMGNVTSGATAPSFIRIAGLTTEEGNVAAGEDQLTWQAVDNRKPVRAIQITLRFLDPTTQQMRTLTIQQGLID